MKKAVMQNAGVNIYENYFESCADSANVIQCFRHPNSSEVAVRPSTFNANRIPILFNNLI